jgi:hypothetical protein
LELAKCPHYGRAAGSQAKTLENAAQLTQSIEIPVQLPAATRLSVDQASEAMRIGDSRVVAIVGAIEAGKTTLVASMYDMFQRGLVDNIGFFRSKTLFAFEEACHHSRSASQRAEPFANRTPIGAFGFYHLGIRDLGSDSHIEILLADRSGEEYKLASDDPSVAREFAEIRRADVITVLVDGTRLLDIGARHNARSSVQMIILGILDSGIVKQSQHLALVLTKADEIAQSKNGDRARLDFDDFVHRMQQRFGKSFADISPFVVAASPKTDVLPYGYGLSELLRYWVSSRQEPSPAPNPPITSSRAINRILVTDN